MPNSKLSTWKRAHQVVAASIVAHLLIISHTFLAVFTLLLLIYSPNYIKCIVVMYVIFMVSDRETAHTGGRGAGYLWFRSLRMWQHFVDYFPVDLVKTAELRADRNYVVASFPHGIMCFGAFANFCIHHSKWKDLFPGIRPRMVTLSQQFRFPILRDILLAWGMVSAEARSIACLLAASNDPKSPQNMRDGNTSNAVAIIVGGAEEAFHSWPRNYAVVLRHRKGFVRMALRYGCPIVPAISFNEVDLYEQLVAEPGSWIKWLQSWLKSWSRVAFVLPLGRSKWMRVVPRRIPITTVVGAPIEVDYRPEPSKEEVDEVHSRFCIELTQLFEDHKAKYITDAGAVHLKIV